MSIVLWVVGLFYGEQFLVCEQNRLPPAFGGPLFEEAASLQPLNFVFISEKLHSSELVRLQVEIIFGYSSHGFSVDFDFAGDFPHRDPRITLDPLRYLSPHTWRIHGALSTPPRTVAAVAELSISSHGVGYRLLGHTEEAGDVALTCSFLEQFYDGSTFTRHGKKRDEIAELQSVLALIDSTAVRIRNNIHFVALAHSNDVD